MHAFNINDADPDRTNNANPDTTQRHDSRRRAARRHTVLAKKKLLLPRESPAVEEQTPSLKGQPMHGARRRSVLVKNLSARNDIC